MYTRPTENTLFLGNGFSRTMFNEIPSWEDLFDSMEPSIRDAIKNYTFLYEALRLSPVNNKIGEDVLKERLVKRIRDFYAAENIRRDIRELENLGTQLHSHNVHNIITTNYDEGIEYLLQEFGGYQEKHKKGMPRESVYSVRTYRLFENEKTGHYIKLWKIHGDLNRIKSITLGYDQYCGSLSRLESYVKGTYAPNENVKCAGKMTEKCERQEFDHISWVELFFRTNVYIAGFAMDFSEIDVWWILNKRARFLNETTSIRNEILYLYHPIYDAPKKKRDIYAALDAFGVTHRPVNPDVDVNSTYDKDYLVKLFAHMEEPVAVVPV